MSYEIIIKQTRQAKKLCGKEWKVVGSKEVERESFYGGQENTRIAEVYDYTPEIEKTVTEEVEILKQVVETLDLPAVIKAINNLQ